MSAKYKKEKRPIDYIPFHPHKAIQEVWGMIDLDNMLNDVEISFYMAVACPGWYEEERPDLAEFHYHLLFFIEAMYFYNKPRDKEALSRYEKWSEEAKVFFDSINNRKRLSEYGAENPMKTIKEFCNKFPITYLRIEVWNFFEATNAYEGEFEDELTTYPSIIYIALLTLCEAGHILSKNKVL